MKQIAIGMTLLLACLSAQAGKPEPFAYSEGQSGTALYYREKCPVAGAKEWHFGILVDDSTTWKSCWIKRKDAGLGADVVVLCGITKDNKGANTLGGACIYTSPDLVYKGNPIPESAF